MTIHVTIVMKSCFIVDKFNQAHTPEDSEELVYLRVPVEEWALGDHLSVDTTNTPDIYWSGVAW